MQRNDDRGIFRRRVAVGQLAEALDLGRLSEPEALRLLARFVFEKLELGGRFDALGENRKSKALSEPEHRTDDRRRLFADIDRFDA